MPTWYQTKIKYVQQDEQGKNKAINEVYLFDAVSYTDAEARAYAFFAENIPDFQLANLSVMRLNEVFFVEDGSEHWFKCRVQYIVFDEKTNQEKKVPYVMLINAKNLRNAYDSLAERLGSVQDYIISDINVTKILEVIPYEEKEADPAAAILAGGNFKPLAEIQQNMN